MTYNTGNYRTYFTVTGVMKAVSALLILQLLNPTSTIKLTSTAEKTLVACVGSIVRRHFPPGQVLILSTEVHSGHLDLLLKEVNEMSRWSLQVSRPGLEPATSHENHDKIGSYIIFIRGSDEVEGVADHLTDSTSWNNLASFLVVVTVREPTPWQQALSVVREMWDNGRALNVVVLVQLETVFHLYTWFPYRSHLHCHNITEVVLVTEWSFEKDVMATDNKTFFVNKVPKNFHGCPIRASVPNDYVTEKNYISSFLNRLNFTVELQIKSKYHGSLYERVRSSIDDIVFGSSEVAFGGIPLLMEIASLAYPSFPYYEITYAWYVPCARPLSRLEAIRKIFPVSVWVSLLTTILLVAVILWCLGSRTPDARAFGNIDIALYNVWAIVMGVSVTHMPLTCRLRVIIFPWICYCFAISTVFQTFFTSYLVDPGLEKQITTLNELLESKMDFGFRPEIDLYFSGSSNWIHQYLLHHKKECTDSLECVNRIIDTASFATITESWFVEKYVKSSAVCRMNDLDSFPIRIAFYCRKGSILMDEFNKIIVSMVESGQTIRAEREWRGPSAESRTGRGDFSDEYFVFTGAHLLVAFFTLLIGHSVGFVVFLGEMLYHKPKTVGIRRMLRAFDKKRTSRVP